MTIGFQPSLFLRQIVHNSRNNVLYQKVLLIILISHNGKLCLKLSFNHYDKLNTIIIVNV